MSLAVSMLVILLPADNLPTLCCVPLNQICFVEISLLDMYDHIFRRLTMIQILTGISLTSRLLGELLVFKYIKSSTMFIAKTFALFSVTIDT